MDGQFIGSVKKDTLGSRMLALGLREADLVEKYIRGSGKGGQKINKTSSCVYIKHIPTGIEIKCQKTRSLQMNRFFARRELCDRIEVQRLGALAKRKQEQFKLRKQKMRRSRRSKQIMLHDKKHNSGVKQMRRIVKDE